MKILFMGTPEIAATCLSYLVEEHTVVAAVCQPDKPLGRRYVMTPPPVKVEAEKLGVPVFQPQALKNGELLPLLDATSPDVIVVVAYGKILPKEVLHHPKYGALNLHVSLLPKYRGAAPIQRAIMAGERKSGVSVMQMDEGLDTGDILACTPFDILPDDNTGSVTERCAHLGGELLLSVLRDLAVGRAMPLPQEDKGASYAKKLEREDQRICFDLTAEEVLARIRGLLPAPGAMASLHDKGLKILSAHPGEGLDPYGRAPEGAAENATFGEVVALSSKGEGGITVACRVGTIVLTGVQPEGKKPMSAAAFLCGRGVSLGDVFD